MTYGLIDAWAAQKFRKPPYKFTADDDRYLEGKTINLSQQDLLNHPDYANIDPDLLHLGLLPVPFAGDLLKADIFIALINPGFGLGIDHYVETIPEFCDLLRRNLKQDLSSEAYPFFSLDPKWHWTGGGNWWHRLLGGIIRALAERKHLTYVDATKLVSKRIASLELVPYHSGNSYHIGSLARKLESTRLMKAYVRDVIIPRAENNTALLVIASGRGLWGIASSHSNVVYPPEKSRRAIFSVTKGAGKMILDRLT
jgi:hypothetical protein